MSNTSKQLYFAGYANNSLSEAVPVGGRIPADLKKLARQFGENASGYLVLASGIETVRGFVQDMGAAFNDTTTLSETDLEKLGTVHAGGPSVIVVEL